MNMRTSLRLAIFASTALVVSACSGGDAFTQLLDNAINSTPTIAVKNDGQTLELNERQIVSGNLTLIRTMTTFNADDDFEITLDWSINDDASAYFLFREANLITNPEASQANQVSIPVYNVAVLQPNFGEPSISATLTLTASMEANSRTYTTTRDFLLTVEAEAVDSSTIPLIPLSTNFTRNNDAELSYVDPVLQAAPRSTRNAAIVRARGFVSGILTDWNTSYITSGEYGLALFRTDIGFRDSFAIGDFIEVTGDAATFNGSRQISWISNIKLVPATDPDIVVRQLTASQFSSVPTANAAQRFRDGSVVRLMNLQFDQVTSGLPTDQNAPIIGSSNHLAIRMKVIDGDNAYNVNLYLNYRLGVTKRQAMYDLLIQAPFGGDTFITYEGLLGWNFGPQLLPLEVANITLQ
jgi:hypothetical protein